MAMINGFGGGYNPWNNARTNAKKQTIQPKVALPKASLQASGTKTGGVKSTTLGGKKNVDTEVLTKNDLKIWNKVKNWFGDKTNRNATIAIASVIALPLTGGVSIFGALYFGGKALLDSAMEASGHQTSSNETGDVKGNGEDIKDATVLADVADNKQAPQNNPFSKGVSLKGWGKIS